QQELKPQHSKLNMASYGSGSLAREFINMAFATTVFFYYEAAIGLDVWIITTAMFIFAIYNMINDPMLGYLINRPFKFTQKHGRRFPWLLMGGIPLCASYLIIFTPPVTDTAGFGQWIIFIWLLLTMCIFDTFHSLYFVNFMALFPEKYRSDRERRTASGIYIPIGVIGVALGAMLPPLIFKRDSLSSFIVQGIVIALICLLGMLLAIPGFREDKKLVQEYLTTYEKNPVRESFFKSLWTALRQNSFIVYMVIYTMYQSQVTTMQNSVNYAVNYVLDMPAMFASFTNPTGTMATFIFASFLIGVIIATPFWVKFSHRTNNNKKVMLISSIGLGITTLPLLFLTNYWAVVITMLIWGLFLGGFWFMIFPVMSDVIDESVAITGRREEGVYAGFSQFFARIGIIAQTLTFAIVHTLTGFIEGGDPSIQPASAAVGIQIHLGLIPAIFIFIGAFVFWRWYKLTPDKIAENRLKIGEFGIK
ncbi:MAG: MFS transporter, partial [Candidatus Hermodarchaeota archaeon]